MAHGLFDNFDRTVFCRFEPENDLERSLVKATMEIGHRPQFFRELLGFDIYVVSGSKGALLNLDGGVQQELRLELKAWRQGGKDWLAMFSSPLRLQASLETTAYSVKLNARKFFEMTRGTNVALNPDLEYGRRFTVTEVESLLSGTMPKEMAAHVVGKDDQLVVRLPDIIPRGLVKLLTRVFAKYDHVETAYLVNVLNPGHGQAIGWLVGLKMNVGGDFEAIVRDANEVIVRQLVDCERVSFARLSSHEEDAVSEYVFRETKPFFDRSLLEDIN